MRQPLVTFFGLILTVCWMSHALLQESVAADDKDQVLFSFADEATVKDWAPIKLPEVEKDQPAPKVEIVPTPKAKDDTGLAGLKIECLTRSRIRKTVGTLRLVASAIS